MKVILREEVQKLGASGDVVEVKDGYGRNFLLPRGLALVATETNLKRIETEKRLKVDMEEKELESAKAKALKLSSSSLTIQVTVGEDEKLFGSVTSMDIAKVLLQEEIEIDRHDILLDEPIKKLGVYHVQVRLHPEVMATVKVWVVKK